MTERVDCRWMKKNRPPGFQKDEPCQICEGYVVFDGVPLCPFSTEVYELFPEMKPLVTEDERLYSIQAGVRAARRIRKQ